MCGVGRASAALKGEVACELTLEDSENDNSKGAGGIEASGGGLCIFKGMVWWCDWKEMRKDAKTRGGRVSKWDARRRQMN